jgi:hypothetical protein
MIDSAKCRLRASEMKNRVPEQLGRLVYQTRLD